MTAVAPALSVPGVGEALPDRICPACAPAGVAQRPCAQPTCRPNVLIPAVKRMGPPAASSACTAAAKSVSTRTV